MSITQVDAFQSTMPEVVTDGSNSEMDKEAFLKLLTIQLANQDPLDPMDSAGMAEQQAAYAQVEQLINLNESMEAFMTTQESMLLGITSVFNTLESASFLGSDVSFYTSEVIVDEEGAQTPLYYDLGQNALVGYTVKDENGSVVKTVPQTAVTAENKIELMWDGTDANGQAVEPGTYSVTLNAQDVSGKELQGGTYGSRQVKAVNYSTGTPLLTLNDGTALDVTKIIEVAVHEG